MFEKLFKLKENGTNIRTEFLAGLTTFAAMAYILAVNPSILSKTGMDAGALITVTAVTAAIGCILMAFMSNLPVALAPGMSTNSYFTFMICLGMGVSWQQALSLTFWNGIVFIILTATGTRKAIINSLPAPIKIGIQAGIGFFIAFIGLKGAGVIVAHPATIVSAGNLALPTPLLTLFGIVLMLFLVVRKIPGSLVLGMFIITIIGFFIPAGDGTMITELSGSIISRPNSMSPTFLKLDWWFPFTEGGKYLPILLTLLLLDMFDSIGTIVGVSRRMKIEGTAEGDKRIGRGLFADAIATAIGALCGTSTVTAFVESASGVQAGGRTGLTSVVVACCFLLALVFSPLIAIIPVAATAPVLVLVALAMAEGLRDLEFDDLCASGTALLTALLIPLSFSITMGISLGLLFYVCFSILNGRIREIKPLTWIMALVFIYFSFFAKH